MGLFDRFTRKKSYSADVLTHEAPTIFYNANELLTALSNYEGFIRTDSVLGQSTAFAKASILDAVLFEKVSAIKDARYWLYDDKGNEVDRPKEMERVMAPNNYENLAQFVAKVEFFSQLYGKAYIAKVKPVGVPGGVQLHVLPNPLVVENKKVSGTASFTPRTNLLNYTVSIDGKNFVTLQPEEVEEVCDIAFQRSAFGGSTSRLVALEEPINTFVSSYKATNELLVNRGMLGIITAKGPGASGHLYTKEENDELLNQLERKYGIMRGKSKYAISSRDLAYIPISSTIKDLGVETIRESCKKDICYTYQIPSVLLDVSGSTFNNFAEAKKKLYTSDIIPSANNIADVLTKIFEWKGLRLVATFDHLDIFQNSKRAQAAGLASLITAIDKAMETGLLDLEQGKNMLLKYLTE